MIIGETRFDSELIITVANVINRFVFSLLSKGDSLLNEDLKIFPLFVLYCSLSM